MDKSPNAFRTISEVATWLETPAHVLRFWESRFPELKPVKRAGGRRYYRPEDMRLLGGIKHLLHTEGHTIKSVQERIKAEGTRDVAGLSPPLEGPPVEVEAASPAQLVPEEAHKDLQPSQAEPVAEPLQPAFALEVADVPGDPAPSDTPVSAVMPEPVMAATVAAEPEPQTPPEPTQNKTEEAPPIGFFFDDSDDAEPAAAQSGTFSPLAQPEVDAGQADCDEQEILPQTEAPEPAANTDPDDDAPGLAPVLSLAARLRALAPGDMSDDHRAEITRLRERLKATMRD